MILVLYNLGTFQSTPSAWRETFLLDSVTEAFTFQSTPSAWRETSTITQYGYVEKNFNPLPPHGGRHLAIVQCALFQQISIHSLRMEGDHLVTVPIIRAIGFQSTPSAWRETPLLCVMDIIQYHFNPLPPHGGRLLSCDFPPSQSIFQSTPSAWRETADRIRATPNQPVFQSTPSAWRETGASMIGWKDSCTFQSTPSAWRETALFVLSMILL